MPTDFVHGDDELYADKRDVRTASNEDTAVTADNLNDIKGALEDVRDYLQDGVFDASTTITVRDLDLTANTDPAVGPEMDYVGYNGTWFIGVDVANSPTSRDFVLTGVRGSYSFTDGATTATSTTLTSASGGGFVTALIGATISGSGIPSGTTITAVGGATSLTMSNAATLTATSVRVSITRSSVQDILYLKHRGALSPTFGIGVTPPDGQARLQVTAQDDEVAMQTLRLRRGPSQTGNVLTIHDSTPTDKLWVDKDYYISGSHASGGAVAIQATTGANGRALMITGNDKVDVYSFDMPTGSGGVCRFRATTGGNSVFDAGTDGSFRHLSSKIGFFGAATAVKPTVTGSRGGNAALASLLTALAGLGLITDSTTA